MAADETALAPAHWIRVQSLVAELCGALVLMGEPVLPVELAEAEAPVLRAAGGSSS